MLLWRLIALAHSSVADNRARSWQHWANSALRIVLHVSPGGWQRALLIPDSEIFVLSDSLSKTIQHMKSFWLVKRSYLCKCKCRYYLVWREKSLAVYGQQGTAQRSQALLRSSRKISWHQVNLWTRLMPCYGYWPDGNHISRHLIDLKW